MLLFSESQRNNKHSTELPKRYEGFAKLENYDGDVNDLRRIKTSPGLLMSSGRMTAILRS
jgi:hypothetical protein